MYTSREMRLSALALAILAAACGAPEQPNPVDGTTADSSLETRSAIEDTIRVPTTADEIGGSWDAVRERTIGACVRPGAVKIATHNIAVLTFDQSMSTEQASRELGFEANAKARFGLFGTDGTAKFSRALASNRLSIATYFAFDFLSTKPHIDPTIPSTWLVDPASMDDAAWYARCGDQFLMEQTTGGRLYVLYRIDFATESDKQEFAAALGASYGDLGSFTGKLDEKKATIASRASVHVEAFQVGGISAHLAQVLKNGTALECRMDNLAACGTFVQNVINYASGQFADDVIANPMVQSETFRSWTDLGLTARVGRSVGPEIKAARTSLLGLFDAQLEFAERVALLSRGKFPLSPSVSSRLPTYGKQADRNLQILKGQAHYCWEDITDPQKAEQITACVNATSMSALKALGYVDGLTTDLIPAARVNYTVGFIDFDYYKTTGNAFHLVTFNEGETAQNTARNAYTSTDRSMLQLQIANAGLPAGASVCYDVFINRSGWTSACDGTPVGNATWSINTLGPVRITLRNAPGKSICYQAMINGVWTGELCNGAQAGTPPKYPGIQPDAVLQALRVYVKDT